MEEIGFATVRLMGSLSRSEDGKKVPEGRFAAPAKLSNIIKGLEESCRIKIRRDSVLILVNGVEANALNDLETVVESHDQVVFIPMFHGGVD